MIKPHKKLNVWQLAMVIVEDVYNLTETFPANERFGLTSQLRRCAVSVPSNIAEGAARNTTKEFINFLHIAQGSISELDTQLEICFRLKLIGRESLLSLDFKLLQVDQMLSGLISSLKKTPNS
jgi:four helix bundle protein